MLMPLKKVVLLMVFFIFPSTVYATDISDYDIEGITLGSSYDDIKPKLPCTNLTSNIHDYNLVYNYWVHCGLQRENSPNGSDFSVQLSNDKTVLSIDSVVRFDLKPDFNAVIESIYDKYGKPDVQYKSQSDNEHRRGSLITMCYGTDCKLKNSELDNASYKQLIIIVSNLDYVSKYGSDYSICFGLKDPVAINSNMKLYEELKQKRINEKM